MGNSMSQLFATATDFVFTVPMTQRLQVHIALKQLAEDVRVPRHLHCNNAPEQTEGKFNKLANELGIKTTLTEPYTPKQNRAESSVREVKKKMFRLMMETRSPIALWKHCLQYVCNINNRTASSP